MAAVTHRDTFVTTTAASTFTSNSFTPALNDLLVAFVVVSDSVLGAPTMTDTQSLGFSLVGPSLIPHFGTNAHRMYAFISNGLAANSSMTVTFNCTGDQASGCILFVASISGMSRTGLDAFLQGALQENHAAGTPAPVFGATALTGNVTFGCVAQTALATTMTPPTNWTEQADTSYTAPNISAEYVSRNSGFTGTTITWGSATAGNFASLILELDTTVPSSGGGGGGARNLLLLGVG